METETEEEWINRILRGPGSSAPVAKNLPVTPSQRLAQVCAAADHLANKSKSPGASTKFHVIEKQTLAGKSVLLIVAGASLSKHLPDAQPDDSRILHTAEKGKAQ